jgi:4-hydroxybenzoate polyprenyltransferase
VSAELVAEVAERSERTGRSTVAALQAARPRQWTKNLLLFAGIVFAAKLGDAGRWLEAVAAFAAYCAASSAAYLVNDVRDREADRAHPLKRRRPVARGDLTARAALTVAALLALAAVALGAALGVVSLALVVGFLALQLAYTLALKQVAFVDAAGIAGLFVLRAAAGAAAVDVRISPWLLVCTALLALFLALAKRRGELALAQSAAASRRRVFRTYTLAVLDRLLLGLAAVTVAVYTAYTFAAHGSVAMPVTVPFVAFGLLRYVYLVRRRGLGEEPDQVLVSDRPILAAVALWVVACALALAV